MLKAPPEHRDAVWTLIPKMSKLTQKLALYGLGIMRRGRHSTTKQLRYLLSVRYYPTP